MKNIRKFRMGVVIFTLFTGIAIWSGTQLQDWASVAYWSVLALVFLLLDSGKRPAAQDEQG